MRHTLIPESELNLLHREYRIRLAIVLLFVLSVVGLVGSFGLFPSFLHSGTEEISQLKNVAELSSGVDTSIIQAEQELRLAQNWAHALQENIDLPRLSDLARLAVSLRGDCSLSGISVDRISTSTVLVSLSGIAPTRDSLLSFKGRLEKAVPNTKVDLPIDQLTQSKNIDFSIKVTEVLP